MKKEKKYSGITEKEVIELREKYGSNELEKKKTSFKKYYIFLQNRCFYY